jgi:hypothetical protein
MRCDDIILSYGYDMASDCRFYSSSLKVFRRTKTLTKTTPYYTVLVSTQDNLL